MNLKPRLPLAQLRPLFREVYSARRDTFMPRALFVCCAVADFPPLACVVKIGNDEINRELESAGGWNRRDLH
jgi:hypothetical protein